MLWLLWLKMAIAFSSCCLSEPKFCSKHRRTSLFTEVGQAVGNLRHHQLVGACLAALQVAGTQFGQAAGGIDRLKNRLRSPLSWARRAWVEACWTFCRIWRMEPSERCRPFSITCSACCRACGRIAAGVVAEAELELSQLLVFFAGEGRFSQRCASWTRFLPNSSEIDMRGLSAMDARCAGCRGEASVLLRAVRRGACALLPVSPG